jgi:hypothetical protein
VLNRCTITLAVLTVATLAAGCSHRTTPAAAPETTKPKLAGCYTGTGSANGRQLAATLRLRVTTGTRVAGSYVVKPAGDASQGLRYEVDGTLQDGTLDGTFTAAGQPVRVTGMVSAAEAHLDDPDGSFAVTRFRAGC